MLNQKDKIKLSGVLQFTVVYVCDALSGNWISELGRITSYSAQFFHFSAKEVDLKEIK